MTISTLIQVERKLHLDALRSQPEFAAFRGVPANLPETAYQRPALLGFFLRHALEASWLVMPWALVNLEPDEELPRLLRMSGVV